MSKKTKRLVSQNTKKQYMNAELPKENISNNKKFKEEIKQEKSITLKQKDDLSLTKVLSALEAEAIGKSASKINNSISTTEKKEDKNNIDDTQKNSISFSYIISILLVIICVLSLGIFEFKVYTLNVLPIKYFALLSIILVILLLFLGYVVIARKNIILKVVMLSIMLGLSFGSLIVSPYLQSTRDFLQGTQVKKDFLSYSVLVLKNSTYEKLEDLKGKNLGYLKDKYNGKIKDNLNIKYNEVVEEDFSKILESFMNEELSALVLESGRLNLAKEVEEEFEEKTKIIYEFEVEVTDEIKPEEDDIKVSSEPFALYISGIDQYGQVKSVRGRSDVNQIMVVNPNTSKVLIVNTPRDYYVQLHGTTGLKDKLTHAGVYGIERSVTTLEDLYNININYYLRVNFNTLIKVVDVIGGIDIDSDKAFTAHTDKSVKVVKGINHFNGKQALAYSRERYTYATGDRHRGENQQQVISAIIDKLTSSEVLMKKYNEILETLDGTFQTNMPVDKITSLIRFQLDKMPKWKVESMAVDGANSMNYTYSMGSNRRLYVMEPNMDTVNAAIARMKEILNEN